MADEKLCADHAAKIGTLEGTILVALPAIEKRLAEQDKLILDIHHCVKGDNGQGLGEIARATAQKLDTHLETHKFYWRNVVLGVVIIIGTGLAVGLTVAALSK